MTCPRCHSTCEVPVEHAGIRTTDACPRCARMAEAEYQAVIGRARGLPCGAVDEDALKVAAE